MIKSLIFGLVQGLTEFLPVSSSGHLFFLQKLFSVEEQLLPVFVLLHLATLCSVLVFFFQDIRKALKNKKIVSAVAVATLFTVIPAFAFDRLLGVFMTHKYMICFGYLVTSVLLLKIGKGGNRTMEELSLKESCCLGLVQALAVVPGISRSGITISALLKKGLNKQAAFTFSFFLSLPVILCAFIYELKDFDPVFSLASVLSGFIVAFLSGLLALKMLKKYLGTEKLYRFGYYCLVLAGLVLFF